MQKFEKYTFSDHHLCLANRKLHKTRCTRLLLVPIHISIFAVLKADGHTIIIFSKDRRIPLG